MRVNKCNFSIFGISETKRYMTTEDKSVVGPLAIHPSPHLGCAISSVKAFVSYNYLAILSNCILINIQSPDSPVNTLSGIRNRNRQICLGREAKSKLQTRGSEGQQGKKKKIRGREATTNDQRWKTTERSSISARQRISRKRD